MIFVTHLMGVEGINKAFYLLHGAQGIRSVIFFRKFVMYSSLNNQVTFSEDKVHWQDIAQIARQIVDKIVNKGEQAYGIFTGLAVLCNVLIDQEQSSTLSQRTLLSHACGVGEMLLME